VYTSRASGRPAGPCAVPLKRQHRTETCRSQFAHALILSLDFLQGKDTGAEYATFSPSCQAGNPAPPADHGVRGSMGVDAPWVHRVYRSTIRKVTGAHSIWGKIDVRACALNNQAHSWYNQYTAVCSWRIARSGRNAVDLAIRSEPLRSTDNRNKQEMRKMEG
jgi:hypothetical protein